MWLLSHVIIKSSNWKPPMNCNTTLYILELMPFEGGKLLGCFCRSHKQFFRIIWVGWKNTNRGIKRCENGYWYHECCTWKPRNMNRNTTLYILELMPFEGGKLLGCFSRSHIQLCEKCLKSCSSFYSKYKPRDITCSVSKFSDIMVATPGSLLTRIVIQLSTYKS